MCRISLGIWPWQAFPAYSNICGHGQESTLEGISSRLQLYSQIKEQAENACQGQNTLAYLAHPSVTKKKSLITSTSGHSSLRGFQIHVKTSDGKMFKDVSVTRDQ
jgi:hypothetical protein